MAKSAMLLLEKSYPGLDLKFERYNQVEFIDQGQNFETVTCNSCGKEISSDFWSETMSEKYELNHFNDLTFMTECCKNKGNLNELIYYGDCGFGKFYLSIHEAEPDDDKEKELLVKLEDIFNTKLKKFWQHI